MARRNKRASDYQVINRKELRMFKYGAKHGLPAKQSANAGSPGLPANRANLSSKGVS